MAVTESTRQWVEVLTMLPTVPYPAISARPRVETERLVLRPLAESDTEALHSIRVQPEVMAWSSLGRPHSVEETQAELNGQLPPHSDTTMGYAICLRDTGEMVGTGGSHRRAGNLGWPVLNYSLRKEFWGKGYASEFLDAFLKIWWSLPRSEARIVVDECTVLGHDKDEPVEQQHEHEKNDEGGVERQKELVTAVTTAENRRSQAVMKSNDMVLQRAWEEDDLVKPGERITLLGFGVRRPGVAR